MSNFPPKYGKLSVSPQPHLPTLQNCPSPSSSFLCRRFHLFLPCWPRTIVFLLSSSQKLLTVLAVWAPFLLQEGTCRCRWFSQQRFLSPSCTPNAASRILNRTRSPHRKWLLWQPSWMPHHQWPDGFTRPDCCLAVIVLQLYIVAQLAQSRGWQQSWLASFHLQRPHCILHGLSSVYNAVKPSTLMWSLFLSLSLPFWQCSHQSAAGMWVKLRWATSAALGCGGSGAPNFFIMSPRLLFFSHAPFHVPCSLPSCDHSFNSLRIKGRTSLQVVAELNVLNARRMPCEANFGTLCSTFLESAPSVSHSPWRGHGRVPSSTELVFPPFAPGCCIEGRWNQDATFSPQDP